MRSACCPPPTPRPRSSASRRRSNLLITRPTIAAELRRPAGRRAHHERARAPAAAPARIEWQPAARRALAAHGGRGAAPSSAAAPISLPDREPPPTSRLAEKESAFVSRPLQKLADGCGCGGARRNCSSCVITASAADDGSSTEFAGGRRKRRAPRRQRVGRRWRRRCRPLPVRCSVARGRGWRRHRRRRLLAAASLVTLAFTAAFVASFAAAASRANGVGGCIGQRPSSSGVSPPPPARPPQTQAPIAR